MKNSGKQGWHLSEEGSDCCGTLIDDQLVLLFSCKKNALAKNTRFYLLFLRIDALQQNPEHSQVGATPISHLLIIPHEKGKYQSKITQKKKNKKGKLMKK